VSVLPCTLLDKRDAVPQLVRQMVLADDMGSYRRDQTLRGVILALSSASQSASAPQTQRALEQVEVFREFLAFFAKVAQTEVTLVVVVVGGGGDVLVPSRVEGISALAHRLM